VPDAVHYLELPTATRVRLATYGSSFDTVLSIRNASWSEVACSDDIQVGGIIRRDSAIDTVLPAGAYYVIVDGYFDSSHGGYVLDAVLGEPIY
jgi:hypothetical protein